MIKKVDHIAIAVRDIDTASRFYTEQLGLTVEHIEDVPSQKVRVAFIPIGDTRIELVQPTSDDSPISAFLDKRGEGLHHLCLESNDIDADLQRLHDTGARMIDNEPREGAHNTRIAFVHPKANSGVLTELAEHPRPNTSRDSECSSPILMPDKETLLTQLDIAQLRTFFESAYKPPSLWKIGIEYEVSGLHLNDLSVVKFHGERDIEGILKGFTARHPDAERIEEHGFCFGLKPAYGNVTLEPGAQIELSANPSSDLDEINNMLLQFLRELCTIGNELNVGYYIAGVDPFHPREARPWSHKERYKVMRSYLGQRGKYAHHMMQQTMSVQFNIDYANEADAVAKYEASRRLQPVFLFVSSNSQIYNGEVLDAPMRGDIWLHTDPDRCGLPPAIEAFDDYIHYALDIPMFLIEREGEVVPIANGLTFREFVAEGFQGHKPLFRDWEQHLSTLFPEVRFKKNALELRMFDGNSPGFAMALCALVKGIFFDPTIIEQVNARTWDDTWDDAAALLDLARQGLTAQEQAYLFPLKDHIAQRKQPGQRTIEAWEAANGDRHRLLEHLRVCVK